MKKLFFSLSILFFSTLSIADNLSDSNKFFDWAEVNFPQYFSPSGVSTEQLDIYLIRYYKDTNTYIGTSGNDVYIFGSLFDSLFAPGIIKVGLISDYVSIASTDSSEGSSNTSGGTTTGSAMAPSVVDCSSLGSTLGETAAQKLVAKGFDKCAMVFGFLVANSITNPSATSWLSYDATYWTQLTANILAEILDNNQDGIADDSKVIGFMQTASMGGWMPILASALEDSTTYEDLNEIFGSDTAMKESWFRGSISETVNEDGSSGGARAIIAQEAIHNWQQKGLANAYPEVFGVPHTGCSDENNMSSQGCTFQDSILTRSTLEAMTTTSPQWYGQNPSGNVFDASLGYNVGDCTTPNCSAIEYYYNLLTSYKGSWGNDVGINPYDFPATSAEVIAKLNSTENGKALLQIMDNTSYHQLINGISFKYGQGTSTSSGSNNTSTSGNNETNSSGTNSNEDGSTDSGSNNGSGTSDSSDDNEDDMGMEDGDEGSEDNNIQEPDDNNENPDDAPDNNQD